MCRGCCGLGAALRGKPRVKEGVRREPGLGEARERTALLGCPRSPFILPISSSASRQRESLPVGWAPTPPSIPTPSHAVVEQASAGEDWSRRSLPGHSVSVPLSLLELLWIAKVEGGTETKFPLPPPTSTGLKEKRKKPNAPRRKSETWVKPLLPPTRPAEKDLHCRPDPVLRPWEPEPSPGGRSSVPAGRGRDRAVGAHALSV